MQVAYTIYEQRYTPESLEDGEPEGPAEEVDAGKEKLSDVLRHAVRNYGICPRTDNDGTLWYCSDEPTADREFFEKGIEKYYTLHIHSLTSRAAKRVNQMLNKLWRR